MVKRTLTLTATCKEVELPAPERGAFAVLESGERFLIERVIDDELEIFVPAEVQEIFFEQEFKRFKEMFASFPEQVRDKFRYANEDTYDLRWYFLFEKVIVPERRKRIKVSDCRRFYRIAVDYAYMPI